MTSIHDGAPPEPKKQRGRPRGLPGANGKVAHPDSTKSSITTGYHGNRRGGLFAPVVDPAARAAARALYEGTPGATTAIVAKEIGVSGTTITRWKVADGWKPLPRAAPELTGKAGQLANTFKVKMSELGKPLSDEVAAAEVSKELAEQHAVDIRAAVLDRHRKEWSAPRKIAYEAIQKSAKGDTAGAFETAKLAKILGETLQIVQVGECRAFGLSHDARGADGGTVVLIERAASPVIEHTQLPEITGPSGEVNDDGEVF